jgi:hypothetical protein
MLVVFIISDSAIYLNDYSLRNCFVFLATGSKLIRGYKETATDHDKPVDISHLVFVVHGIGQKMNIGAQIFRNTSL